MAVEMVPIRSVKQYLREFGYDELVKNGADKSLVKEQILDAFQKEIFGQITLRYHDPALLSRPEEHVDEKTREGIRHIISNSRWKWKKLCAEFDKYRETRHVIEEPMLMERLKDIVTIQENDRDKPGEIPMEDGPVKVEAIVE